MHSERTIDQPNPFELQTLVDPSSRKDNTPDSGKHRPGINPSDNAKYSNFKFPGNISGKSGMRRLTIASAVVFFITTVVFVVLFTVYYIKHNDEVSSFHKVKVCDTPDCVMAAAIMAKKMNFSADPCHDFNEFACGRFNREAVIPEGMVEMNNILLVDHSNQLIMKEIITEDIKETEPKYLSNMKRLYRSCTNEAQIESIGLDPYFKEKSFVNDWPTLNSNWNKDNFNLSDTIVRYARVYISPIFKYIAKADFMNSSNKVIYLGYEELGLSMKYFAKPRNDSVIMAYQKYLAETAIALNASRNIAMRDAEDVVNLEIEISKIMTPKEENLDLKQFYNVRLGNLSSMYPQIMTPKEEKLDLEQFYNVRLGNLSSMYPQLNIPAAMRAAFATANVTLSDHEIIINTAPTYIGDLSFVIQKFSSRTLQNLFGFKYALSRVGSLTRRMREIHLDFVKTSHGMTTETPRWQDCLDSSSKAFSKGMSKHFVARAFSDVAKDYVNKTINTLKNAFKKMVEENTWMGKVTKDEVYKKLAAMGQKIGYPDVDFKEKDIEQYYKSYNMTEDNYYSNRLLHKRLGKVKELASLRTPVDRNEWPTASFEGNAYYPVQVNEMIIPAGILQSPVFSLTFPDSMNYGAIGSIIGHEITHGFDNEGSYFDAKGNIRNWWQARDREVFMKRIQCIVDQYSNFRVEEINMTLDGIYTQSENVADNGGVKGSFRAYKEYVRKKGENPKLPGLELTQDQIFFLAYAQFWCDKMTPQASKLHVTTEQHPPGKFRIIGPLQNSPEFAKAYNCPAGSYMNPVKKCSVW